MELIVRNTTLILLIVAALCTTISVITEFIKDLGPIKKIPTKFLVLIVSLVVCTVSFFAYETYAAFKFVWYYIVGIIIGSFIIACICTNGWEYLIDTWKKFYKKDIEVENERSDKITSNTTDEN